MVDRVLVKMFVIWGWNRYYRKIIFGVKKELFVKVGYLEFKVFGYYFYILVIFICIGKIFK